MEHEKIRNLFGPYPSWKDTTPELEAVLKDAKTKFPQIDWDSVYALGGYIEELERCHFSNETLDLLRAQMNDLERRQTEWVDKVSELARKKYEK